MELLTVILVSELRYTDYPSAFGAPRYGRRLLVSKYARSLLTNGRKRNLKISLVLKDACLRHERSVI